jgi:hypothetical protein
VFNLENLVFIGKFIRFLYLNRIKIASFRKIPINIAAQKLWELMEKQKKTKGIPLSGYRDPEKTLEFCIQHFLSAELVHGEVPPSRRIVKVNEERQNVWSNGSDSNLYDLNRNIIYKNAFLYKRDLKNYLKIFKA